MSELISDILQEISENLETIEKRFSKISAANDFISTEEGTILLDAIGIRLMAIGESVNKIKKLDVELLAHYPSVEWDDVIRFRNFIAHHYELLDYEVVFSICKKDLPALKIVLRKMLDDFKN